MPVKAILGSTYIQASRTNAEQSGDQEAGDIFGNLPEYKSQMIGMMEYEPVGVEELRQLMRNGGMLDVTTDGGLKIDIGTSSYAFLNMAPQTHW